MLTSMHPLFFLSSICAYWRTENQCHDYLCSPGPSIELIATPAFENSSSPTSGIMAPKSKALFGADA